MYHLIVFLPLLGFLIAGLTTLFGSSANVPPPSGGGHGHDDHGAASHGADSHGAAAPAAAHAVAHDDHGHGHDDHHVQAARAPASPKW